MRFRKTCERMFLKCDSCGGILDHGDTKLNEGVERIRLQVDGLSHLKDHPGHEVFLVEVHKTTIQEEETQKG